jgi:hypothetical protein
MTHATRTSVFAPRPAARMALASARETEAVGDLVAMARKAGGRPAAWRIGRTVNAQSVQLVGEAVAAHFAARRDELMFRIALTLDNAKKRAIAESIEDTAVIEHEIVRMTKDVTRELIDGVLDEEKAAALEEVRRTAELEAMAARGEITRARLELATRRVAEATDEKVAKATAVAERVIANLGERLDAALREVRRPVRE